MLLQAQHTTAQQHTQRHTTAHDFHTLSRTSSDVSVAISSYWYLLVSAVRLLVADLSMLPRRSLWSLGARALLLGFSALLSHAFS